MPDLPEEFIIRMKKLLAGEWEMFSASSRMERKYGLRVNTLKIRPVDFERIAPFSLTPIPWISGGYYYSREDGPAGHPFYAAGLYYLQEPSAMTPASRLIVEPGDRVLDLCAAPGGKATALAAGLSGKGLLVANDINRTRARALLRNLELSGVRNCMVTNEPPHVLKTRFPEYFDKIMVDAPCSGEGMFRKNPAVMDSWKEKGPEYFSALQKEIILHAADMLRPGGQMLYSTCTFAPEENEGVITHLLEHRPQMEIIPMKDYEGFRPGIAAFDGQIYHDDCRLCRRIWPHLMEGEGHFMALLRKREEARPELKDTGIRSGDSRERPGNMGVKTGDSRAKSGDNRERPGDIRINPVSLKGKDKKKKYKKTHDRKDGKKNNRTDINLLESFLQAVHWPDMAEHLDIRGDKVYYLSDSSLKDCRLHFLRNGIYLGEMKKNRFEPSQPFALALSGDEYDHTVSFPADDERLLRYLRGEGIEAGPAGEQKAEDKDKLSGFVLVMADGYPLGWGKLTGHIIKNKYPPAWRRKI